MGDRGNIVVDGVWLYTHWDGCEIKQTLQSALVRGKDRWDDSQYLARIIFCEMLGKNDVMGLTDYGISIKMYDNEYNILVVDTNTQTVKEVEETDNSKDRLGTVVNTWSFNDFISAKFEIEDE